MAPSTQDIYDLVLYRKVAILWIKLEGGHDPMIQYSISRQEGDVQSPVWPRLRTGLKLPDLPLLALTYF